MARHRVGRRIHVSRAAAHRGRSAAHRPPDRADDERGIGWARALCADLKPYSTGAVYLNFIGDEGHDRVVAGFGRKNYDRLAQLKAEYDPGNVFHLNQNVVPA